MPVDKKSFPPINVLLVLIALLIMPSGNAEASAINECIDACFIICQSGRDRCVEQCNKNINGRDEPAPVTGAYGAIAYDEKSGAWGMADASQDKSSAKESALAHCSKHGSDCEIVESFSKTCAAVAAGTGNRLAWAVDDNPKQAGLDAIEKCGESKQSGDKSRCFLQLYHCYSP
jgi:hypothetical protein